MIRFGKWLPDLPSLENKGGVEAKNVIPAADGYRCLKDLTALSGAASTDLKGMFTGRSDAGVAVLYAGDTSALYKFVKSDSSLTDIKKSGGYSTGTDDFWNFAQFGERIIATNYADNPQKITANAAGLFSDLGGTPPKAKFITVVRDQVMLGYTNDGSDGEKPYRLWWSGINNDESWTSGTNLSDYQDVADIGACSGLIGGENLTAFFEKGIVRGQFVGAPLVYQFDKLTTQLGCSMPGSITGLGGNVAFFIADEGFFAINGSEIRPIGVEKVNRYFYDRLHQGAKAKVHSAIDPINNIVMWAYPSVDSDGTNDELIIYNYRLDNWSRAVLDCDVLAPITVPAYTLEDLDGVSSSIDSITTSFDDPSWEEGFFVAAGKDKKIQTFTGACLSAVMTTAEFSASPGKHSLVNSIIPYVELSGSDDATITAEIGSRSRLQDQPTFSSAVSLNTDGFIPTRSEGRYHRVRVNTSGNWTNCQGIEVDVRPLGVR